MTNNLSTDLILMQMLRSLGEDQVEDPFRHLLQFLATPEPQAGVQDLGVDRGRDPGTGILEP